MSDPIDRQMAINATKKQIMLEYVWATEDGNAETEAVVSLKDVESLVEAICKQTKRAIEEEIEELPTIDADVPDTNVGDLISRQMAIERIVSIRPSTPKQSDYSHGVDVGMAMAIVAIKEQPSAQPERTGRWIPCSKGLPDELQEVNITYVNTNPESYYEHIKGKPFTASGVYFKGRWYWYSAVCRDYLLEYGFSPNDVIDDSIKVTAWMSFPEPYSEVKQ